MARLPRASQGGIIYHVLNRGNARQRLFFSDLDYILFLSLLALAQQRIPMRIISYCLMPNHWHLLVWPYLDGEISKFMHWLCVTHTQRWHLLNQTIGYGHIYQGRFKSFPVEQNFHLMTVARYIERNALRAKLVTKAQDWKWGSLHQSMSDEVNFNVPKLEPFPIERFNDWAGYVNCEEPSAELAKLRLSNERGRPYGSEVWTKEISLMLGITQSLRNKGGQSKPPLLNHSEQGAKINDEGS